MSGRGDHELDDVVLVDEAEAFVDGIARGVRRIGVEHDGAGAGEQVLGTIKAACGAPVIANNGYTLETAQAAIGDGHVDAVAFGKLFIANPDLPRRLRAGGPYNEWDMKTFYGGSEKGYTDYPALPPSA